MLFLFFNLIVSLPSLIIIFLSFGLLEFFFFYYYISLCSFLTLCSFVLDFSGAGGFFFACFCFVFRVVLFFSISTCTTACKMWLRLSLSVNQAEGRSHQQTSQQLSRPNYNSRFHITHTRSISRESNS